MDGKLRTIIENENLEICRSEHCVDCKRFDRIAFGLVWNISRAPRLFEKTPNKKARVAFTEGYGEAKKYRFYFKEVDSDKDNELELLHFEPVPED